MLRHVNPHATEPLQTEAQVWTPAAGRENADRSITPQEKNIERDEEERAMWRGSIYSFILFIQQNKQGSGICCNSYSPVSITVKFQIRGFTLPTFMVTSKPACCLQSPPAKSDYLDFYRLRKLQVEWKN